MLTTAIMVGGRILSGILLYFSEKWIDGSYQELSKFLRWILFLPVTFIRLVLFGFFVTFQNDNGLSYNLSFLVNAVFVMYSIGRTIPLGKKIIPIVLSIIWIILDITPVFLMASGANPHYPISEAHPFCYIAQVISLVIFSWWWLKKPKEKLYSSGWWS